MNKMDMQIDPQEEEDPVQLNQEYRREAEALKTYMDRRFKSLPELLGRETGRGRWRYDSYLLMALLLLSLVTWRIWTPVSYTPIPLTYTPTASAREGSAKPPAKAVSSQTGAVDHINWMARIASIWALLVKHRVDLYVLLVLAGFLAVFWKLHILAGELQRIRSSKLPFDSGSALLSDPLWEAHEPPPGAPPASAAPLQVPPEDDTIWRYFLWLPWGRAARVRTWRRLVRDHRERAIEWLHRLATADGISPRQLESGLDKSALRWRQFVEQKRDLGISEIEQCIRVLFQYLYARWLNEQTGDKRRGTKDLPRITGRSGMIPSSELPAFLEARPLGFRSKNPDPDDLRLQMIVVEYYLRAQSR